MGKKKNKSLDLINFDNFGHGTENLHPKHLFASMFVYQKKLCVVFIFLNIMPYSLD